jgi:hypothetical protein
MSFNAGGANVGGVQVREPGVLKIIQTTVNVTADGTLDNVNTVPAGKIWILKYWNTYKSTGTYTLGGSVNFVKIGSNEVALGTAFTGNVGGNSVQLTAGQIFTQRGVISGWSVAGNTVFQLLVQELDA